MARVFLASSAAAVLAFVLSLPGTLGRDLFFFVDLALTSGVVDNPYRSRRTFTPAWHPRLLFGFALARFTLCSSRSG